MSSEVRQQREANKTWNGKGSSKVSERFVAAVRRDGPRSLPLQEMANRHEAAGFKVIREFFDAWVPERNRMGNVIHGTERKVPFMRVSIERGQLEFDRDA